MPVLGKQYTKRINLDGYDDEAYVVILTNPKMDVWGGIDTTDPMQSTYAVLSRIITDWNFTDDQGQKIDLTPENVRAALSAMDVIKIQENLGLSGLSDKKKDNS